VRSLILILAIAIAFGAAAAWQSRRVEALKAQRAHAEAIARGRLAETPSGDVSAGWAVVTVGRPSGMLDEGQNAAQEVVAAPIADTVQPDTGEPESPIADSPVPPGDDGRRTWELTVTEGQSLSKIAAAHYGSAARELLEALARYNALASPDELRVGQRLELPPLDVLLARSSGR
jgi:nucleoid-associated protein YgaU